MLLQTEDPALYPVRLSPAYRNVSLHWCCPKPTVSVVENNNGVNSKRGPWVTIPSWIIWTWFIHIRLYILTLSSMWSKYQQYSTCTPYKHWRPYAFISVIKKNPSILRQFWLLVSSISKLRRKCKWSQTKLAL